MQVPVHDQRPADCHNRWGRCLHRCRRRRCRCCCRRLILMRGRDHGFAVRIAVRQIEVGVSRCEIGRVAVLRREVVSADRGLRLPKRDHNLGPLPRRSAHGRSAQSRPHRHRMPACRPGRVQSRPVELLEAAFRRVMAASVVRRRARAAARRSAARRCCWPARPPAMVLPARRWVAAAA